MQFSTTIIAVFGAALAIMPVVSGAPGAPVTPAAAPPAADDGISLFGSCVAVCLVAKKVCDTGCLLLGPCEDHCDILLKSCLTDCGASCGAS